MAIAGRSASSASRARVRSQRRSRGFKSHHLHYSLTSENRRIPRSEAVFRDTVGGGRLTARDRWRPSDAIQDGTPVARTRLIGPHRGCLRWDGAGTLVGTAPFPVPGSAPDDLPACMPKATRARGQFDQRSTPRKRRSAICRQRTLAAGPLFWRAHYLDEGCAPETVRRSA